MVDATAGHGSSQGMPPDRGRVVRVPPILHPVHDRAASVVAQPLREPGGHGKAERRVFQSVGEGDAHRAQECEHDERGDGDGMTAQPAGSRASSQPATGPTRAHVIPVAAPRRPMKCLVGLLGLGSRGSRAAGGRTRPRRGTTRARPRLRANAWCRGFGPSVSLVGHPFGRHRGELARQNAGDRVNQVPSCPDLCRIFSEGSFASRLGKDDVVRSVPLGHLGSRRRLDP